MEIEIKMRKLPDFDKPAIIDGFPSVGLVSSIAASYIVEQANLELLGCMISDNFPPMAVIKNGKPSHPVRIYGNEKLVVFISEFHPKSPLILPLARKIVDWAEEHNAEIIVSTEGLPRSDEEIGESVKVYGIPSSDRVLEMIRTHNLPLLENGIVTGISGTLLNEGIDRSMDVLCIISEAHQTFPDARSAAKLVETIDLLLPQIEIDTEPLMKEAERIEKYITDSMEKVKSTLLRHDAPYISRPEDTYPQYMYR